MRTSTMADGGYVDLLSYGDTSTPSMVPDIMFPVLLDVGGMYRGNSTTVGRLNAYWYTAV